VKKTTKVSARRKTAVKDLVARKSSGVKGGAEPVHNAKLPRTTRPVEPING
jgi:hypothetical protein